MVGKNISAVVVIAAAAVVGCVSTAGAFEDKTAELAAMARQKRATDPLTLTNGTGDGRLTVKVDGYGSFGSTTPAGDVSYDPVGAIGPAGAVWESAVMFSPTKQFLATGSMHVGQGLPPVEITRSGNRIATSSFSVGGFDFTLRQEVLPPAPNGSTLVQTYKITNRTGRSQTIALSRYVEGDLYFVGSFGNDFGGVSGDGRTVYQFDTGDDPSAPTTFVGINATGGTAAGYSIQPYRFTDAVVAAGRVPTEIRNKIHDDANADRITDHGFDAGIIQQNNMTIRAGATATYVTRTRFGSGSIVGQISKVAGCITMNGNPVVGRTVEARQTGLTTQTTTTDATGCYEFDKLTVGKPADIVVKLPTVTQ
ncbi:hypothetical protein [Oharaeibacter diazotrophicus]|uniref:Carboxypeptidase family protein n=1 Tax=Oharaeibacter diazotrophicus TaxID=1920512 RepID=A0A4R6RII5_9HYPH|nr:hypothetical protein [Oharaeibacter diazotrophicus]TDP86220.1 hypothetical protein EDD54_0088 [Oharaeibacter diazotrophicus]BBE71838.1 hypothetical protein OHA_1_01423 [Pleomorphomonas sp. SM30]GLS78603.1 hypothetical protein GCM10007904_39400 [Oharaeibacter diazotrophicus]